MSRVDANHNVNSINPQAIEANECSEPVKVGVQFTPNFIGNTRSLTTADFKPRIVTQHSEQLLSELKSKASGVFGRIANWFRVHFKNDEDINKQISRIEAGLKVINESSDYNVVHETIIGLTDEIYKIVNTPRSSYMLQLGEGCINELLDSLISKDGLISLIKDDAKQLKQMSDVMIDQYKKIYGDSSVNTAKNRFSNAILLQKNSEIDSIYNDTDKCIKDKLQELTDINNEICSICGLQDYTIPNLGNLRTARAQELLAEKNSEIESICGDTSKTYSQKLQELISIKDEICHSASVKNFDISQLNTLLSSKEPMRLQARVAFIALLQYDACKRNDHTPDCNKYSGDIMNELTRVTTGIKSSKFLNTMQDLIKSYCDKYSVDQKDNIMAIVQDVITAYDNDNEDKFYDALNKLAPTSPIYCHSAELFENSIENKSAELINVSEAVKASIEKSNSDTEAISNLRNLKAEVENLKNKNTSASIIKQLEIIDNNVQNIIGYKNKDTFMSSQIRKMADNINSIKSGKLTNDAINSKLDAINARIDNIIKIQKDRALSATLFNVLTENKIMSEGNSEIINDIYIHSLSAQTLEDGSIELSLICQNAGESGPAQDTIAKAIIDKNNNTVKFEKLGFNARNIDTKALFA